MTTDHPETEHVLPDRELIGCLAALFMHDQSEHRFLAPFLACYDELARFLTRKLGCKDLAAEVVQETYLRMTRVGPTVEVSHPRAFLFRTAANLATDVMRKRHLRSQHEVADIPSENIPSQAPGVDVVLDGQQQYLLLRQAVATLPQKCRTVFLLHKAEHLSYAQVAARLNISTSAVEKHMSKALAHCRDYLERGR